MLSKLEISFKRTNDLNFNMGSIFQSILMEQVKPDYAEKLHCQGIKPYAQHCIAERDSFKWTVAAISEEADREHLQPLLSDNKDEIYLRYKDLNLKIIEKRYSSKSYNQLM